MPFKTYIKWNIYRRHPISGAIVINIYYIQIFYYFIDLLCFR